MTYRIARNGQVYGPYSSPEVHRYLASGQIVATDLGQSDSMQEWLPIADLFPSTPMLESRPYPGGLPRLFPDPPNLPWWVALLLGILTLGAFFQLWDILQSLWMRRVEPRSIALYLYLIEAVLYLAKLPSTIHNIAFNLGYESIPDTGHSTLFLLLSTILFLATRFTLRRELLRHFNGPEPIGLHLNAFFTLLFGGLYFQFHFNRINALKHTLRLSVPTP